MQTKKLREKRRTIISTDKKTKNTESRIHRTYCSHAGRRISGFSEAGYPIYDDEIIEPYINFAKEIVMRAEKEYEETYQKLLWAKREKTIRKLLQAKEELESFFDSDWLETLTGTHGQGAEIIRRAKKRAVDKEKERLEKEKEKEDTVI